MKTQPIGIAAFVSAGGVVEPADGEFIPDVIPVDMSGMLPLHDLDVWVLPWPGGLGFRMRPRGIKPPKGAAEWSPSIPIPEDALRALEKQGYRGNIASVAQALYLWSVGLFAKRGSGNNYEPEVRLLQHAAEMIWHDVVSTPGTKLVLSIGRKK